MNRSPQNHWLHNRRHSAFEPEETVGEETTTTFDPPDSSASVFDPPGTSVSVFEPYPSASASFPVPRAHLDQICLNLKENSRFPGFMYREGPVRANASNAHVAISTLPCSQHAVISCPSKAVWYWRSPWAAAEGFSTRPPSRGTLTCPDRTWEGRWTERHWRYHTAFHCLLANNSEWRDNDFFETTLNKVLCQGGRNAWRKDTSQGL